MGRIRITIRSDGLAADAAADAGPPSSIADVRAALVGAGVVDGIDEAAVLRFTEQVGNPTAVPVTTIAQGRLPEAGTDGRVERSFPVEPSVGRQSADGRIDYHERDLLHPVAVDQLLGRIVPPTPGLPGVDVRGRRLDSKPGKAHTVRFGPGVRIDGDRVLGARAGVVLQDARTMDVVPLWQHGGDVDLRSGNLHTEGSLSVRGDVRDGFAATAGGDVVVGGTVQHGTVTAGGGIRIEAGVLEGSTLKAKGCILCRHTTSSRLDAGLDIDVRDEATHSQLRGEHIRIVTGHGTAFGGELRARGTITLTNAGTAVGAPTLLSVADVTDEAAAMVRSTNQDTKVERTALRVRRDAPGPAGKGNRMAMKVEDQAQQQRLLLAQRQRALLKDASVQITGDAHTGVRIQFGSTILSIDEPRSRVRFRWDAEQNKIVEETLP